MPNDSRREAVSKSGWLTVSRLIHTIVLLYTLILPKTRPSSKGNPQLSDVEALLDVTRCHFLVQGQEDGVGYMDDL